MINLSIESRGVRLTWLDCKPRVILPKQERIKGLRELIPHICPLPIVIRLKLFLKRIGFPAETISSRVAWKFRGGIKVQKHVVGGREIRKIKTIQHFPAMNVVSLSG